jgi:energy-coupling factor transporter ATP-binding protein EcfA2
MRIISLEVSNFKAIRAVAIVPNGNVVQITGENGAGKTSIMDAIYCALAGKRAMPLQPVHNGEDRAVIRLDLGEVIVTRRIVAATGHTEVIVEQANGARFPSPQKLLDDLLGALSFDPLAFAVAGAKSQLETLRGIVKLDVDVDALDRKNVEDTEARRDINRDVASLKERVESLQQGLEEELDMPIDVAALTARMAQASEHNTAIEREKLRRTEMLAEAARLDDDATKLEARATDLRRQADELDAEAAAKSTRSNAITAEWVGLPEIATLIDVRDVQAEINEATAKNSAREAQLRQRENYRVASEELGVATAKSERLTAAIQRRTDMKRDAIARAKMPVDGLAFGEGLVLYKGVPFKESSEGDRIRVSLAVGIALNPKLRVMLIRNASLMDDKNLALVSQMAEAKDYQVFLERVDSSGKIGIVIQDGLVAAIDGVPVDRVALADAE